MTEQELAALEAAAKAATPSKRRVIIDGTCSGATPRIVTEALDEFGEPFDIAELSTSHVETAEARESSEMPGSYDEKPHRFELTSDGEQILADADFMAKADPTTIQSLIAACRKARALALEEAANECERMMMYPGGRCEAPAHENVWKAATAIRRLATKAAQSQVPAGEWYDAKDGVEHSHRDYGMGMFFTHDCAKPGGASPAPSAKQEPVLYGVFAKVDGQMVFQWPPRFTRAECETDMRMYHSSTVMEIRPLFAAPSASSSPAASQYKIEDRGPLQPKFLISDSDNFVVCYANTKAQAEFALSLIASPAAAVAAPVAQMTPEMMRAVQLKSELGAYAAANLANAYDLFREFWTVACAAAPVAGSQQVPEGRTAAQAIERIFQSWDGCTYDHINIGESLREDFAEVPGFSDFAAAAPAVPVPVEQEAAAWMTEDGDRAVTEKTMAGARKDGGAMLSSMKPYTVKLVREAAPSQKEGAAS